MGFGNAFDRDNDTVLLIFRSFIKKEMVNLNFSAGPFPDVQKTDFG
jgi:hypothetical protein